MNQEISIPGLYYRYKKTSDADIRTYLNRIAIVVACNKGIGTYQGYYPLSSESICKIMKNPRGTSLSFDAHATGEKPIEGLKEYKTIKYLVKSSSRFFLKPDIGEIFDQIPFRDLLDDRIKAIEYIPSAYTELADTQGEHFVMEATLLCKA